MSPNTVGKKRLVFITSILRSKLSHCGRQTLVELMLAGDEGLADGLLSKAQDTGMSPNLVHKGLKHHPFIHVALLLLQLILLLLLLFLCIYGLLGLSLHSRTHPPLALATLLRALASSRTQTQCGGGPIRQGHTRTLTHALQIRRRPVLVSCITIVVFSSYSHDVFRSCCCDDHLRLCCWRFCWSNTKDRKEETEEKQNAKI